MAKTQKVKRAVTSAKPAKRAGASKAAKPNVKSASRPTAKAKRPVAKKAVAKKAAPAKVAKPAKKVVARKPVVKSRTKVATSKKASGKTGTGSKIAIGVVSATMAATAGAVAIKAASKAKSAAPKKAPVEQPRKNLLMPTNTNGKQKEVAPGGGIVQPATKSAPAMRLRADDAEILASAKERYGRKDLDMFKKLLIEQRQEAKEEFDILSQNILDTSGEFEADNQTYSLHTAEQGTDAIEREKTFLHAQRTSDYIKKLDEALERIERGTYGICVICGGLIEKERLQAVPITQKHVDCKNRTQVRKPTATEGFRDFEESAASAE